MKIGEIIASQLGGTRKLNAMTGAYNFMLLENGLSFRLKNPSANYVKIELNGKDLYDVEIGRVRGSSYKIVQEYHDIYNDQLKEVIEMGTGMYLSFEDGGAFGAGHFAEGGILSSSEIEKLDNGFTIKELSEMLNNKFRDSFQFEVYKQGKNRDLTTDYDNKLKDDKLKLKFYDKTSGRDLNYEVMQGEENTYFHFLLSDSEYNGYVGTFGFKDRGDVSKEYVTKFVAFLHDAYHYPFSVKHSVMENGGAFGAGHFAEGELIPVKNSVIVENKDVAYFKKMLKKIGVESVYSKDVSSPQSNNYQTLFYFNNEEDKWRAFYYYFGLYADGGAFGAGHFAEGGDINAFTMQMVKGTGNINTEVITEERKISFEDGGAFGAGHFAKGGELENINFNFTVDKWGGFEIGDGEYFTEDLKSLFDSKPEFFIKTEKIGDYYETTFIPNPFNPKELSEVKDKDLLSMYKNSETYKTTKSDILKTLQDENQIGIFNVVPSKKTNKIEIGDMAWYRLGLNAIGVNSTMPFKESPKYKELEMLYKKHGGNSYEKFVPTVKFKVGDLVWDKGNKRYGTVMNIFDDPINGADGELRLDSDGMQIIFTYNKKTYENTGYNLIKLGEEGDEGNFTFDKLEETKNSANRLINSQIKYKDKENEKYYRTVYKRLLDGEFDSKISYKKYIPHANIKTVTIKKGGKELTYKAEDVYNGVYVLENGGGLKGRAFYTKKADVVKVTLNDGSEVMPVNGFWIKKTAEPITGATTSDADSVFKRIIRDAKLVKVGDSKKYDAKDLKKINAEMVKKLLEAGYTEQQIRNKFLGYTHDNEVLADGEFAEYETTIFSYMEDYIPTIIQQLVDAQKSKTFAVTFEYPEFDWTEIIKKYKISTTPKEFVKKREGTWRYDYYYQFFQGENIVIDHNYGYKEFDKEGKLIGDTTKDGKKLVNANKLSAWQKERGEKAGFNNGFWTVSSSKIEVIDDVIKMLTSQKDGYCKEIEFYSDYNSELLKENGAKFENGGAFGAGHFAMGGKVTFDEKSAAIAKNFVGKSVEPKYQSEYGETYSKEEASEVGDKIAGAQRAKYESKPKPIAKKKASGGLVMGNPKMKAANDLAKQIRKDGEKWSDALKRAHIQLKG